MPVRRKAKTQYVEHYEEYVGEEMKPFVALLAMETNQMEKDLTSSSTGYVTNNAQPPQGAKRKVRFWKRITAFFS
jgi:hypothetical protein